MPQDQNLTNLLNPQAQNALSGKPQAGLTLTKVQTAEEQVKDNTPPKKRNFLKWLFAKPSKKTPTSQNTTNKVKENTNPKIKNEHLKELKTEQEYYDGLVNLTDLIAPSSLENNSNYLKISDKFTKTFFIYAYPRFIETNWLSSIINLDSNLNISLFIYPSDSEEILKTLKKKVVQMRSTIRMNSSHGKARDPGLETALQDAEELRDSLVKGQEKFFHLGLYLTIYSNSQEGLDKKTIEIESILGSKMVLTKRANLQMEHGFVSTLPLGLDEIQISRNMNTSPLSATFPFSSSSLSSDKGILYGLNRHNDSLIIFDRFSLENSNSVVFAKSGAGKSYAIKLEILRLMMTGTDVLVIDPENEYQDLCKIVGGTFINISLNSSQRINPFDLPLSVNETTKPGDLLRSAIINLHGLFNLMLGNISDEEEAIIDKALLDCYALKGITMETEDFSAYTIPTMHDFYNVLSNIKGAESLKTRLEKYTTGSFAGIFNKKTNIDLGTGMLVFNIRDLEDELRPIASYIVLNFIWNKVRSSLKKRILVVDEAWVMMQHENSAKFMYGLVKRARKYWLGVTTITQDVEDFIESKYGKAIITNSSMQLLLKQSSAAIDNLSKIFNLTDGEKYMLLNSSVGQGIFFAGNQHVACQIIASYSEDKVVTTNPEDKQ